MFWWNLRDAEESFLSQHSASLIKVSEIPSVYFPFDNCTVKEKVRISKI